MTDLQNNLKVWNLKHLIDNTHSKLCLISEMGITFRPQQLPPPRGLMLSRWGTAALTQTWSSTPTTTPTVPAACQTMWSSPVPTNSTLMRSSWGRISVPRRTKVSVNSPVYRYHGGDPELFTKADRGQCQLTSLQMWGESQLCLNCVTTWRVDCQRGSDLH